MPMSDYEKVAPTRWLNRTTLGVGLPSLLSDRSHKVATAILPALLISFGADPGWLGAIEGVASDISNFTKLIADKMLFLRNTTVGVVRRLQV